VQTSDLQKNFKIPQTYIWQPFSHKGITVWPVWLHHQARKTDPGNRKQLHRG